MTISKSQGKTLPIYELPESAPPSVIIDLSTEVVLHGSIYVAFSRVRNFHYLAVVVSNEAYDAVMSKPEDEQIFTVHNVVYPELLDMGLGFALPPPGQRKRARD